MLALFERFLLVLLNLNIQVLLQALDVVVRDCLRARPRLFHRLGPLFFVGYHVHLKALHFGSG